MYTSVTSTKAFLCVFYFEWRFYALSASMAIFRARTRSHITYSVRWWWLLDERNWWMKLGESLPPGHDALIFSIGGTGSFIDVCPVAQTRLDIPRPLITQSHRHGWTYQAFDYPVTQTRLDIPRPLITQSHRHGWTYQGLWLPSHTDTAGHTKAFDYPVTQTRQDIPRSLITQSHRHGWTYQGLWLPSHTDTAGHTKACDYPVTQTRLDIPRPLITQSHRHGWTYQAFDYPVTQTGLDIPRPLITQSHRHGWTYQGLWLPMQFEFDWRLYALSASKAIFSRRTYSHRRMGTLWLGGQRGWFARNFTQITGADTGFPERGGGEDIPQAPPPPWTLFAWRHPPSGKLKNTPTLGHSQAPPPHGHCPCDVIHIPRGGGSVPVTHTFRFSVSGQVQGGGRSGCHHC